MNKYFNIATFLVLTAHADSSSGPVTPSTPTVKTTEITPSTKEKPTLDATQKTAVAGVALCVLGVLLLIDSAKKLNNTPKEDTPTTKS